MKGEHNYVLGSINEIEGNSNTNLGSYNGIVGSNNWIVGSGHKIRANGIRMFGPNTNSEFKVSHNPLPIWFLTKLYNMIYFLEYINNL